MDVGVGWEYEIRPDSVRPADLGPSRRPWKLIDWPEPLKALTNPLAATAARTMRHGPVTENPRAVTVSRFEGPFTPFCGACAAHGCPLVRFQPANLKIAQSFR
jgi:hypothetical protein